MPPTIRARLLSTRSSAKTVSAGARVLPNGVTSGTGAQAPVFFYLADSNVRLLAIIFAVLIAALQWPLWVGKGGWLRVWQLDQQVAERKEQNVRLQERNDALEAEVGDLKTGTDAIEERARNELGMLKQDEVFFQILDKHKPAGISSINASRPESAQESASSAATKN